MLFAGAPSLLCRRSLKLRFPQAAWCSAVVAGTGAGGGVLGHYLFLKVLDGPLETRAAQAGSAVGLGTSMTAWSLIYFGRRFVGPFQPGPASEQILKQSLPVAVVSGPLAGILVSRAVVRALGRRFGG